MALIRFIQQPQAIRGLITQGDARSLERALQLASQLTVGIGSLELQGLQGLLAGGYRGVPAQLEATTAQAQRKYQYQPARG